MENLLEFPQVRDWFLIHKPLRLPLRGSGIRLMRIISVINFGNHLNAPKVLLEHVEERAYRQLFFSRIVRPTNSGGFSRQVAWFTDSQSPVQIVEVGSMKLGLHRLAVKIFQFCEGPVDPANGK